MPAKATTTPVTSTTHLAMGTVMTHKAFGPRAEESLAAVCREVARIEGLLSRFIPGSDISRVNRSAGMQCEPVSRETIAVLAKAVEFSRAAQGCFDVTIEPLVRLWSAAKESLEQPDDASIQSALPLVNALDLILEPWEGTAGLRCPGQAVDLGGIGKGYAGDRILEVFKAYDITSAYSNLGGNVVALGSKPDGSTWRIGIQHPRDETRLIGAVSVVDQSVVTSGDYQRFYTDHLGRRHHHILDPRTGFPAASGLISVSIVAEKSLTADALSTLLFVAGMEKGLQILIRYPGTDAILVDENLRVFITRGLIDRFQADEGIEVTVVS